VTSVAFLEILKEKFPEITPSFCAGLSLGEFSALVGAQALSFRDGLSLVQKRAEAMERTAQRNPGTMASILGFSQTQCEEVAKEAGCEVANLNSPDQIVLSGTVESVTKACSIAEAKGAKRAILLKVGGAFHSTLMREAKEDLENALKNTPIQAPRCVFIPNATAQKVGAPEEIRTLLAKQLMSPVRWIETMDRAAEEGLKLFLEIGPGKVLKGLARKTRPELSVENLGTVTDIEKLQTLFAQT
jgi:[acyl-carrier-protein] S-malonyltransferase